MASDTNASEGARASLPPREDLYRVDYSTDMEIRSEGEETILTGHFTKYNEWAEINSSYEGRFMERSLPGAFDKTISESLSRMRVLFNHGRDILGEQILGPIRSLVSDELGPRYEVPLFRGIPQLILEGLRAGQYGASYRFQVVREKWDDNPGESEHNPLGLPERSVIESRVREFGPVTFGAFAGATAGIRSITDEIILGRFLEQPDTLRAMLLHYLPDEEAEQAVEEETAPTENRAEPKAHPVVVRRGHVPLFGLDHKEKPSWQL